MFIWLRYTGVLVSVCVCVCVMCMGVCTCIVTSIDLELSHIDLWLKLGDARLGW